MHVGGSMQVNCVDAKMVLSLDVQVHWLSSARKF